MLTLFLSLLLTQHLWAQEDPFTISPEDPLIISAEVCSLECVLQGGPECNSNYCRIIRRDVFGGCIPQPCREYLNDPAHDVCGHYVGAPTNVTWKLQHDEDLEYDTALVFWRPSLYGISFLRGFKVTVQVGLGYYCQQFLFQRNFSVTASHAQRVLFRSDPFRLPLGVECHVTVMPVPIPENWNLIHGELNLIHTKTFSTRSCLQKNGLERCRNDWHPRDINVTQEGPDIIVTFDLAPPNLGISQYFSQCDGEGLKKKYITPNSTENQTYYSYNLIGLHEGKNYTCVIAVNQFNAVRRIFTVQVQEYKTEPPTTTSPSLSLLLPLGLVLAATLLVLVAGLTWRWPKLWGKTLGQKPDISEPDQERATNEEVISLTSTRTTPPRLLICYSRHDGPAHINAVMQLAAFLQQHMATQVCLDLWDSLRLAEEGLVGWLCSRLQETDFVLVLCSEGLCRPHLPPGPAHPGPAPEQHTPSGPTHPDPAHPDPGPTAEEQEEAEDGAHASVAVALISEELGRAKANGSDLSKYMTAIFEYSAEADVPVPLRLASGYTLPRDLAPLFSQLHGVPLYSPGGALRIQHISGEGYATQPAGAALRRAVQAAALELRARQGGAGGGK